MMHKLVIDDTGAYARMPEGWQFIRRPIAQYLNIDEIRAAGVEVIDMRGDVMPDALHEQIVRAMA